MGFAFEDLLVYQKSVAFSISVINAIDIITAPRKHYRLIEQLEASCTSVSLEYCRRKGTILQERVQTVSLYFSWFSL